MFKESNYFIISTRLRLQIICISAGTSTGEMTVCLHLIKRSKNTYISSRESNLNLNCVEKIFLCRKENLDWHVNKILKRSELKPLSFLFEMTFSLGLELACVVENYAAI